MVRGGGERWWWVNSVLSIQSHVSYGHVGNSAAVLPLQRLGFEVWPVNTIHLSNHLGHTTWRGEAASLGVVSEIVAGIDELGVLAECSALLSGFLGGAALGGVVLDALDRLRQANPDALFACDPVLGDDGIGIYVPEGVPEYLRDKMLPRADIVTPNRFEAEFLTGKKIVTLEDALAAVDELRGRGPGTVVVTSVPTGDGDGVIGTLAANAAGTWLVRTPRLDTAVHGTGDVFAALFLGHSLRKASLEEALSRTVSSLHGLLTATVAAKSREIVLVDAQDALVTPPKMFAAEKLR